MGNWKWKFLEQVHAMLTYDSEWCTKLLVNDCVVFVCEFTELDSCLIGLRRYPAQ